MYYGHMQPRETSTMLEYKVWQTLDTSPRPSLVVVAGSPSPLYSMGRNCRTIICLNYYSKITLSSSTMGQDSAMSESGVDRILHRTSYLNQPKFCCINILLFGPSATNFNFRQNKIITGILISKKGEGDLHLS